MAGSGKKKLRPAKRGHPIDESSRIVRRSRRGPTAILVAGLAAATGLAAYYFTRSDTDRHGRDLLPVAIPVESGAAQGFNVLLITLDTTRADRIGCYGYPDAETPNIDALAGGGVRFVNAVTAVPITLPSHSTLLTGLYPPNTGVRDNGVYRLAESHQTLAERLREKGYATAAFVAAFVLDRRYGLSQGFDHYNDEVTLKYRQPGVRQASPQRPAVAVVDAAIAWLDGTRASATDQPFFAWVHLFDPHRPLTPPEPFRTRHRKNLYDGEIAYMDAQIGRLIHRLRESDRLRRTVVAVVGDHGEGLGDHDEPTHSLLIYDSVMRVPFIVSAPGVITGGRVIDDRIVSTADLMPTILDLVGAASPEHRGTNGSNLDGVSLLRPTSPDRAVYMETLAPRLNHGWSALHALRTHRDKYIAAPTEEYYDLIADPGELVNLLIDEPARGDHLVGRLEELMTLFNAPAAADAAMQVDAAALQKLQALGYLGAGVTPEAAAGPLPDPKQMVSRFATVAAHAVALIDRGRFAEAIPVIQSVLEVAPNDARQWSLLSTAQERLSQLDDAIRSRMKSIELQPGDANHWLQLAGLQRRIGDLAASDASLTQAATVEPNHGEVYVRRALNAIEAGDTDGAILLCREARRRDPTRHTASSWWVQGSAYERIGQLDEAKRAYERAFKADPRDAGALLGLARFAEREANPAGVVELAERILPGEGQWVQARPLLARALLSLGRSDDAIETMRTLTAITPNEPRAHNNLGNVYYQLGRHEEALSAYETASRLNPDYLTARFNRGTILAELGRLDDAVAEFEVIVEADPGFATALGALVRIHASRGEIERGLFQVRKWLASGATSIEAIEADTAFRVLVDDPRFQQIRSRESQSSKPDPPNEKP